MSDWIYGFFMAWGMFLTIPCPKKIWRESARRKMLACLPLIGLIVGSCFGIFFSGWAAFCHSRWLLCCAQQLPG